MTGISAVVVVIVGGIIVLSVTAGGNGTPPSKSSSSSGDQTSSIKPALQKEVEDVPLQALLSAAGSVSLSDVGLPQKLPASAPQPSLSGRPEILYIGAEWCPFCAAERWPLVMALSKFGTFGPLRSTMSSSTDELADTPTFAFHNAKYTSRYISFVGIEEQARSGAPLDKITAEGTSLMKLFDKAPYVAQHDAGSIPVVYLGGRYIVIGAEYSASSIAGTPFASAVHYLTSGTNPTSKAAEAAAGFLVRDICVITHGKPRSVCSKVPGSLSPKGA